MTEVISLAMSECFSGSMMGMPPPTDASKASSLPAASAASITSLPWVAMSALLAVTTFLPAASAFSTTVRAMVVPPMSSTTISISGSLMMLLKLSVNRWPTPWASASAGDSEHTRASSISTPKWRRKSSLCFWMMSMHPPPTVPVPTKPIFTAMLRPLPSAKVLYDRTIIQAPRRKSCIRAGRGRFPRPLRAPPSASTRRSLSQPPAHS